MTDRQTRLIATVAGEMSVDAIPVAPWANIDQLTKGDEDICPVIVRVPEGKSTRGWYYTRTVLDRLAGEINRRGLPGYEGHQRPEDVPHEFKPIVTHWIGARVMDEGGKAVLYARGLVDKSADHLKRWIRGRMIQEVSIFGMPTLVQGSRGTEVSDYKPFSIDWTPPGRNGMPTSVVYAGEIDATDGRGSEGGDDPPNPNTGGSTRVPTVRELCGQLRDMNVTPQQLMGEMNWRAGDVLPALNRRDVVEALGRDTIAAIPVGEIAAAHKVDQLLPAYQPKLSDLAPVVDKTEWERLQNVQASIGEMAGVLGLEKGKDSAGEVLTAVKGMHEDSTKNAKAARKGLITRLVGEMVSAKAVRPLMERDLDNELAAEADEAAIKKAIGEMKDRTEYKDLLSGAFGRSTVIDPKVTQERSGGTSGSASGGQAPNGLVTHRRRL